jgi:hypothetical protein
VVFGGAQPTERRRLKFSRALLQKNKTKQDKMSEAIVQELQALLEKRDLLDPQFAVGSHHALLRSNGNV